MRHIIAKTIVILGTIDKKGEQPQFLKKIEGRGHDAPIMDLSMGAISSFPAEMPAVEIGRLMGHSIEELMATWERSSSRDVMIAVLSRRGGPP
jgi:uncharacterized protein (UPF0261 family)